MPAGHQVVAELLESGDRADSALARAPWAKADGDVAMMSPQFEIDRERSWRSQASRRDHAESRRFAGDVCGP
jgi:hypothetical protein